MLLHFLFHSGEKLNIISIYGVQEVKFHDVYFFLILQ